MGQKTTREVEFHKLRTQLIKQNVEIGRLKVRLCKLEQLIGLINSDLSNYLDFSLLSIIQNIEKKEER